MKSPLLKTLLIIYIIAYAPCLHKAMALEAVKISDSSGSVPLGKHVQILEDETGKLDISSVSSLKYDGNFKYHESENVNLGLSKSVYWLRFSLISEDPEKGKEKDVYLLNLGTQYVYYADLYSPDHISGQREPIWSKQSGGTLKILKENELVYQNAVFSLPELSNVPMTFYLRVESKSPYFIPLRVEEKKSHEKGIFYQLILFGLFYGIMTGLFFYNLFLFISLRETSRFYYLLYLLTITLYFSAVNRFSTEFVFRHNPALSTISTLLFLGISSAFAMLFAQSFLSTRKIIPGINRILNVLIIVSLALSAGVFFFEYSLIINYFTTLGVIVPVVLMTTGTMTFLRGNKNARFYILASFVFLAGTIVFSLTFKSILPYNNFTFYNFQIATVIEAILLSIALADRINILNTNLEEVNKDLKAALEVAHLGFHDHLTGLYNLRFLQEELKRLDTKRNLPITLVLADANGLKLTNDVFGHLTGDTLLQKAASLFRKECRADDIIARTGGDEFVFILPHTDSSTAGIIVNRIKAGMHNEKAGVLPLSISFGLATKNFPEQSLDDIYKQAEDQMYTEKLTESENVKQQSVETLLTALFEKNENEKNHAMKVSRLSAEIGRAMNFDENRIKELERLGMLHDIGKVAVPDKILEESGSMHDDETEEIKRHCENGYRILSQSGEYSKYAEYVLAHHERWDGQGYPKGLKGDMIPLYSRITGIAEAYAAMTDERPYRAPASANSIVSKLRNGKGTNFDPDIYDIFISQVLKTS